MEAGELLLFWNRNQGGQTGGSEVVPFGCRAGERGSGDAEAQRILGDCYFWGEGIREDKQEAVKWFRLAAGQGYVEAQRWLGDCYFFGNGVGKNKREAVNWYFLSAKKGNAEAQRRLGACFYFGHGVAKNRQEAIRWYRLAAEQGNSVAISMLKKLGVM